jgi:hypothetical protein
MPRGTDRYDEALLQGRLWTPRGRSNLLLRSEELATTWTVFRSSISSNAVPSPDGFPTADKIREDGGGGSHGIFQIMAPGAIAVVYSCHFAAAERTWCILQTNATGAYRRAWFDLANGVVGTAEAGLTSSILNLGRGWFRCSVALTSGAGGKEWYCQPTTANSTEAYVSTANSGVYAWGVQVEPGTVTKGYIRTAGAASTDIAGDTNPNKVDGVFAWQCAGSNNGLPASHPYKNRPPLIGD